jgi:DNA-binding protein Fis
MEKNMKINNEIIINKSLTLAKLERDLHDILSQYVEELTLNNPEVKSHIFSLTMAPVLKCVIEYAMRLTGGNQSKAARLLGISRATIRNYLTKYFGRVDVGCIYTDSTRLH